LAPLKGASHRDAGAGPIVPSYTRDIVPLRPAGSSRTILTKPARRRLNSRPLPDDAGSHHDDGQTDVRQCRRWQAGAHQGQKAILKNKDGNGSVTVVVNGTLLVQIEGSQVSDADLRAFASAIDYAKISALL
jgi:hypothetical protein